MADTREGLCHCFYSKIRARKDQRELRLLVVIGIGIGEAFIDFLRHLDACLANESKTVLPTGKTAEHFGNVDGIAYELGLDSLKLLGTASTAWWFKLSEFPDDLSQSPQYTETGPLNGHFSLFIHWSEF